MTEWWSRRDACRLCGQGLHATDIIHFDETLVAGAYIDDLSSPSDGDPAAPLSVTNCPGCGLVQLREQLAPAFYRQYGFTGATGSAYRIYLNELADRIATSIPQGARVLEVGCGDGTLLAAMAERGLGVRGFEPADFPRSAALRRDLEVSSTYFSAAAFNASGYSRSRCIVVRHVLEHIDDFTSLFAGIDAAAEPDAHLLVEVPDLAETVAAGMYGNFYHPHACYFDHSTLTALMHKHGWRIAAARIVPVFGGSLFLAACRGSAPAEPIRFPSGYPDARTAGIDSLSDFSRRWLAFAAALRSSVRGWRKAGLKVAGYGAAERTGSVIGTAGLDSSDIMCLYDRNPFFAGKFLPKLRIPIRQPDNISAERPDILVVFAQSHEAEIINELAALRQKGMRFFGLRADGLKELEAA